MRCLTAAVSDVWVVLLVPINPDVDSWEEPTIERERNFGQNDHVRQFCRDYAQVL
ncbi:MAG: hypothetical protein ACI358_04790 [Candidatus Limimorpha sp.]